MANIDDLKKISILEVADKLGMVLKRTGSYTYSWNEHDSFTINVRDNYFNWFSRSNGGDVIKMVQVVKKELEGEEITFNQAKHFLEERSFNVVDPSTVPKKEPFNYYLQPYETKFIEARDYLNNIRGLKDETIDFFGDKGVLAQATKKTGNYFEPVIVFKSLDSHNRVIGASLQGIRENKDPYERGRLKQIMRASDGMTGMHIDIGNPKRLIFAEAPIDLMSYYELHKDTLQDVRLVAMDGLKESTVSRHMAELLAENGIIKNDVEEDKRSTFLSSMAETTNFFDTDRNKKLITLAVDNDEAGHTFIDRLESKGIKVTPDLPPKREDQDKTDWNDYLKESKEKALDRSQELTNNIGGELINRNSSYLEGKPSRTALQPEESMTQPDFPANVQLYFNIDRSKESSVGLRKSYRYASDKDVRYLNRYAEEIQKSANWYLRELADSKVTYFYQDKEEVQMLQVEFEKRHWMHLTGIAPVYHKWVDSLSEQFVEDIASGKGDFANLSLGTGFRNKVKILPILPEIFESDAFVFDDLSSVEKMGRLDVSSAIRSDDRDILLAFRTDDDSTFPATLLQPNKKLNIELNALNQEKTILGVFVEKDEQIRTLSVNPNLIKDGGQEMIETLRKNKEVEPFKNEINYKNGGEKMTEDEERKKYEARKEERERDSDGDGIPDEIERNQGTNPYSSDTDGDGKSDNEEIAFGSNPIDANSPNNQNKMVPDSPQTVTDLIQAKDNKGLSKVLKEGVKDYFESDTYKQYLKTMSQFHNYSPRNIQMIMAQNPKATHVASFKKWKEFERNVNKGEKALRIFAPITLKRRDPKTNEPILDKDGKEQTYTSFKMVPVFDISQTSGKELAKPVYQLDGSYKDFGNLFKAAKTVSEENGVPIVFKDNLEGADGSYSRMNQEISILRGMSEQQTLKTIFHEMAHSELHTLDNLIQNPLSRSTKELQAESVAFVVSSHYGLDASDYSFGYLASWSEDKEGLTDLEEQIKIVQKEANNLITKIDKSLEKYKSKDKIKDPLQEKIDRLKIKEKEKAPESKKKEQAKELPKKEVKSNKEMNL